METRRGILKLFVVVAAAVTMSLLECVSGLPPTDNVVVEVKLEKELHLISRNSSLVNNSDTVKQRFQCLIQDLSEDELSQFSLGKSQNVIVSSKAGSVAQPVNVEFDVVNDTLVVTGEVLMKQKFNESSGINSANESVDVITSCEIIFLEAEDSGRERQEPLENVTSRHAAEETPVITTQYDHVVLMKGAPEQVISCTARSTPRPQIRWVLQGRNGSDAIVLSRVADSRSTTETIAYLLFSQVDINTRGNYTCIAENRHGRATKTFEIEVISVEAINPRCNDITNGDGPPTSRNQKIIFKQNIHEILRRSKRHLWYQWRSTKIYDPPYHQRFHSLTREDSNNSDLQKMVNLVAERLNLADKVAVHKWDNNLPVEDIPREQIILDNVVRQAENRGLDPGWAHRFFRDQIEANKDVQYELLRSWEIYGSRPPGPPVDLGNEVRPEIDYINGKLLELARDTESERRGWECRSEVEESARYAAFIYNFDPLHVKALQRAVENLCIVHRHRYGSPRYPYHPYPPPPPHDFPPN